MHSVVRARLFGVFVVAALIVSACSSDGNPGFGPTAGSVPNDADDVDPAGSEANGSGTEADLEAAATESFDAFLRADDQTYFNLLSRSCRELRFAAVEGYLDGRRFLMDNAGIDLSALGIDAVELRGFDGSTAQVVISMSGAAQEFPEATPRRWIFQDGGWRLDECDEITPSRGGLGGVGTDRGSPLALGGVADVDGWLVSLGFVNLDSESDVLDLGGPPAPDGTQLVVAQIGLTYIGTEPLVTLGDTLAFAMVSGSTVYGDEAGCATDSDIFVDPEAQAGPGEALPPAWVCRAVADGDVGNVMLRVTHTPTATDYWFDLS